MKATPISADAPGISNLADVEVALKANGEIGDGETRTFRGRQYSPG